MLMMNLQALDGSIFFHSFNDEKDVRDLSLAPIKISDVQLSNFHMYLDKVTYQNVFLQKNYVENTYNRYFAGMDKRNYEFISVKPNPSSKQDSSVYFQNMSRDGGKTF